MIKLIVFDMAGTTVDEGNAVYKALRKAMQRAGHEFTLDQVLELAAGRAKKNAVEILLYEVDAFSEITRDQIHKDFQELLRNIYSDLDIKPCIGTEELLDLLQRRGIKRVLNTGYARNQANQILAKLGWEKGKEFDLLVTAGDVSRNRPFPDMIKLAMEKLEITDAGSVMKVGDSMIDIEEGKSANVALTVGVTTGAHTHDQLQKANPDYIFDTIAKISDII